MKFELNPRITKPISLNLKTWETIDLEAHKAGLSRSRFIEEAWRLYEQKINKKNATTAND